MWARQSKCLLERELRLMMISFWNTSSTRWKIEQVSLLEVQSSKCNGLLMDSITRNFGSIGSTESSNRLRLESRKIKRPHSIARWSQQRHPKSSHIQTEELGSTASLTGFKKMGKHTFVPANMGLREQGDSFSVPGMEKPEPETVSLSRLLDMFAKVL